MNAAKATPDEYVNGSSSTYNHDNADAAIRWNNTNYVSGLG
jgi:hypothetical protein